MVGVEGVLGGFDVYVAVAVCVVAVVATDMAVA